MRNASPLSYCALTIAFASATLFAGCGEPVREDRSITFSKDGGNVAFQHGDSGVFVADEEGAPQKIFQPGSDAIATSAPLWAPDDKRLIFTVAKPDGNVTTRIDQDWDLTPEGRVFVQQDILYECWLRATPQGAATNSEDAQPKLLFTARCNHPGYIAANLAVRWHPDGQRIIYVNKASQGKLALFEYSIASDSHVRISPNSADAIIFGTSPGGTFLHCLAANSADPTEAGQAELTILEFVSENWLPQKFEVGPALGYDPNSGISFLRELQHAFGNAMQGGSLRSSWMERLQSTAPAWAQDESRLAFVNFQPAIVNNGKPQPVKAARPNNLDPDAAVGLPELLHTYPGVRSLIAIETSNWTSQTIYKSQSPLRDLRWSADNISLAFLEGDAFADLKLIDSTAQGSGAPAMAESVRELIGWNVAGDKLAYISPEIVAPNRDDRWTFLLIPVAAPRDRVLLLSTDGNTAEPEAVLRGLRITFPLWSPTENKLSLWGTYSPTHQSWLTPLLPFFSLPPGDPAAVFDADSGEISWLAINGVEEAQVAHHLLLTGDFAQAWEWYQKSNASLPKPRPITIEGAFDSLRQRMGLSNTLFFQSYCLDKLGRIEESEQKLREFRRTFAIDPNSSAGMLEALLGDENARRQLNWPRLVDDVNRIMQDQYMGEAFLSLDAAEDGVVFFRREMSLAKTKTAKHSSALCLSQMLLVAEQYDEYIDVAFDEILPQLANVLRIHDIGFDRNSGISMLNSSNGFGSQGVGFALATGSALALAPLGAPDFLAKVSPDNLRLHAQGVEDLVALVETQIIASLQFEPQPNPQNSDIDAKEQLVPSLNDFLLAAYYCLGEPENCRKVAGRFDTELSEEEIASGSRNEIRQLIEFLQQLEW